MNEIKMHIFRPLCLKNVQMKKETVKRSEHIKSETVFFSKQATALPNNFGGTSQFLNQSQFTDIVYCHTNVVMPLRGMKNR